MPALQSVFVSYAHADNEGADPAKRWLDRLQEHLSPLVQQDQLNLVSDEDIELGEDWQAFLQTGLSQAVAAVLLVSPAFLASKYIRNSELPVLLRNAAERGVRIIPVILRPCFFEGTRFRYPDPRLGPEEFTLASLQAAGSPQRALSEMSEGEQDRALLKVAQTLARLMPQQVGSDPGSQAATAVHPRVPTDRGAQRRSPAGAGYVPVRAPHGELEKRATAARPSNDGVLTQHPQTKSREISRAATRKTEQIRQPSGPPDEDARCDTITARADLYRGDGSEQVVELTLERQAVPTKVVGRSTQARLVDEMVRIGASSNNTADQQIRRTLYELLMPPEIEPYLSESTPIVLRLDAATASWPWELIDSGENSPPWAVRTKLLRKLLSSDSFPNRGRVDSAGAFRRGGALVIGEPQCDTTRYGAIPGAREEAQEVANALDVRPLLEADALQVMNNLIAIPPSIVHISGHGETRYDLTCGVVLSNDNLFGPREIAAMRHAPELVFVNCCFVGGIESLQPAQPNEFGRSRAVFAASFAEQLIRIGVRCVVVAGWPVEDGPSVRFAVRFFERVQAGHRFIDAVGAARVAAWESHPLGNTWGAFQCYGDPDWRYLRP